MVLFINEKTHIVLHQIKEKELRHYSIGRGQKVKISGLEDFVVKQVYINPANPKDLEVYIGKEDDQENTLYFEENIKHLKSRSTSGV